jgi:hypothetical protein
MCKWSNDIKERDCGNPSCPTSNAVPPPPKPENNGHK